MLINNNFVFHVKQAIGLLIESHFMSLCGALKLNYTILVLKTCCIIIRDIENHMGTMMFETETWLTALACYPSNEIYGYPVDELYDKMSSRLNRIDLRT